MNLIKYDEKLANKDKLRIYFFKSNDCGVCVSILEKMKEYFKDYDLNVYIIDIEKNPKLRGEFLVFTGPTILLLKEDKVLIKESGFVEFENLKKALDFII